MMKSIKIITLVNDSKRIICYLEWNKYGAVAEITYPFIVDRNEDGTNTFTPYLDSMSDNKVVEHLSISESHIVFSVVANTDVAKLYEEKLSLYKSARKASA